MIPKILYEPLPYVCVAAGTWAFLTLAPFYGKLAGLLLVAAGGVIYRRRWDYRRK